MIRHKLKFQRLIHQMTQKEVAEKTNIAYRRYSRLERGKLELTIHEAIKLYKLFQPERIEDLLEDEELRDS